jgi:hypothetical protein
VKWAITFAVFTLARRLSGSIPSGGDTESSAREFNVFSGNLEVWLAIPSRMSSSGAGVPGAISRYLEAARDSLTER